MQRGGDSAGGLIDRGAGRGRWHFRSGRAGFRASARPPVAAVLRLSFRAFTGGRTSSGCPCSARSSGSDAAPPAGVGNAATIPVSLSAASHSGGANNPQVSVCVSKPRGRYPVRLSDASQYDTLSTFSCTRLLSAQFSQGKSGTAIGTSSIQRLASRSRQWHPLCYKQRRSRMGLARLAKKRWLPAEPRQVFHRTNCLL